MASTRPCDEISFSPFEQIDDSEFEKTIARTPKQDIPRPPTAPKSNKDQSLDEKSAKSLGSQTLPMVETEDLIQPKTSAEIDSHDNHKSTVDLPVITKKDRDVCGTTVKPSVEKVVELPIQKMVLRDSKGGKYDRDLVTKGHEYKEQIPKDQALVQRQQTFDFIKGQGFEFHQSLGKGDFGEVFRCTQTLSEKDINGKDVKIDLAVKVLRLSLHRMQFTLKEAVKVILKGQDIHNQLRHKYIVKSESVVNFEDTRSGFLWINVLSFMELFNGNLRSMVDKQHSKKMSERQAREWFIQIVQGLQYLHNKNVVHLDIKPQNILYTNSQPIIYKLTDFGLSRMFTSRAEPKSRMQIESLIYRAPEMSDTASVELKPTDIYSLGITLAQSLSGFEPPEAYLDLIKAARVRNQQIQDKFKMSRHLTILLTSMTNERQPRARKTVQEIIAHPWYTNNP